MIELSVPPTLWFDVEKRYNTTLHSFDRPHLKLWFDVEKRYNTTDREAIMNNVLLWFDVEKRYNTTYAVHDTRDGCCGLM